MKKLLFITFLSVTVTSGCANATTDPCDTEPNDCALFTVTTTVTVFAADMHAAQYYAAKYIVSGDAEQDGMQVDTCVVPAEYPQIDRCTANAFPFDEVTK